MQAESNRLRGDGAWVALVVHTDVKLDAVGIGTVFGVVRVACLRLLSHSG